LHKGQISREIAAHVAENPKLFEVNLSD